MTRNLIKIGAGLLAIVLVALAGLTACTSAYTTTKSTSTPTSTTTTSTMTTTTSTPLILAKTIDVTHSTTLGDYLVDGNGMTLYYFTKDSPGVSNATAAIIANWPVFYAANIVVPPPLNAADFGSITRSDGSMQTTFKGYPLYYYIKDKAPGDTAGQGLNNVWFVINPAKFPPTTPTTSTSVTTTTTTSSQNATIDLVASNFAFNQGTVTVPAGASVTVNFNNQDSGVPHNFAVYTDSSATTSIFVGQAVTGPGQTTYKFTAPGTHGTHFFRCDFHPS